MTRARKAGNADYAATARRRWPAAEWIIGDGPYASVAYCDATTTIMLFATPAEAESAKAFIDRLACGHACLREHEIADLGATRRRSAGRPAMTGPLMQRAVEALTAAVTEEGDFAGWLAAVLAEVAARVGGSEALTAGRPGSWEASLVDQLVKGTVGYDDEYLPAPAGEHHDQ